MPENPTERLLDAARELVEEGLPLTLTAVAKRTGLARGTVYRHFAGLGALREALVASGRVEPERLKKSGERLLDAVAQVLRARGPGAMTLEEVAREAGVSPVTLYRRFGDREGLLRAFVAERTPRRLALVLPGQGLEEDLLLLARESLSFLAEDRGLFNLVFSADSEAIALVSDLRRGSLSVRELGARVMEGRVPGDPREAAHAFLGILLALGWETQPGADVEPLARRAVSLCLRGVLS
jgi:AcrR family transcriptional regulator